MIVTFWKIVKDRIFCGRCNSKNLKQDKHKNIICKDCGNYVMLID